jgi:hypothetical protein
MSTTKARVLDLSKSTDRAFVHLLVNTLLLSVISFTVWFAVTFWVFLRTKSVLATGVVAGVFLATTAVSGIWFGSLVDHYGREDHHAGPIAGLASVLCRRPLPLSRGGRADHPSEGCALREAGPGPQVRPEHRGGRFAADGVPDWADHAADLHPVHDDWCGCRTAAGSAPGPTAGSHLSSY